MRDFVTFLHARVLAVTSKHGKVLGADGLAGVELGEGVDDAVGLVWAVEVVDERLDSSELRWEESTTMALCAVQKVDLHAGSDVVADRDQDLVAVVLVAGVAEFDRVMLRVAAWQVLCCRAVASFCSPVLAALGSVEPALRSGERKKQAARTRRDRAPVRREWMESH